MVQEKSSRAKISQKISDPKKTILVLVFLVSVAFILGIGFLLIPNLRNIDEFVTENHLTIGNQARDATIHFVKERIDLMKIKGEELVSSKIDFKNSSSLFLPLMQYDPSFAAIYILDGSGQLVNYFTSGGTEIRPLLDYSDNIIFHTVKSGETYISPVFYSETQEPFLTIAVPLSQALSRESEGIIIVDFNLRFLWAIIKELKVGKGGKVYVVDERKNVIGDPNIYKALEGVNVGYRKIVSQVISTREMVRGGRYRNEYKVEVLATALPISIPGRSGWGVIVEQPLQEILEAKNRIFMFILAATAIVAFLLIIFARGTLQLLKSSARLAEKENEVSALISNFTDGLIEYDKENTILLINPAAEALLGVKAEDVIHRKIGREANRAFDPFGNLSAIFFFTPAPQYPSQKEEVPGEIVEIEKPILKSLAILDIPFVMTEGKSPLIRFAKIIRDITRERLISKTKSEFISLAAHQLRTPVSTIKWALSIIMEKEAGEITQEQEDLLKVVISSNNQMITLINDFLNVAQIEEGKFSYIFVPIHINNFLAGIINEFLIIMKEKNIDLVFKKSNDSRLVLVDEEKLRIALVNIINNAFRYTPKGGNISIRLLSKKTFCEIQIEDNGVGIPLDHQNRIFSKFFRAKNAAVINTSGSGLGLYITKNIIDRHKGKIWFVSQEGRGTIFFINLPYVLDKKTINLDVNNS